MVDNSSNTFKVYGTSFVINPGSGPVADSTPERATENMRQFIADIGMEDVRFVRVPDEDEHDGRFAFLVYREIPGGVRSHMVTMPGLPLEQVRFMGGPGQDPWDFPRLYVDWSSWLWKFAVNCCTFGQDDESDDE